MFKAAFLPFSRNTKVRHAHGMEAKDGHSAVDVAPNLHSAKATSVKKWSEADRALVEGLDEPTLVIGGSTVAIANRAAQKLLGTGIEGRDIRLVIRHPEVLACVLADRSDQLDVTGIGELGRSWRLLVRNIGQHASLIRMTDRSDAVSAEKMRVDFVANASHELRTPLSTVLGYAETLVDEPGLSDDLRHNFGRTICDEAKRMLRIIEDLMSLSRIEADRFLSPDESVAIEGVIAVAIASARRIPVAADCEFNAQVPASLPRVRGDRAQLIQVMDNLLSNAVRYGRRDGKAMIDLDVASNDRSVTIAVTDHGSGIPREHLSRVTERFYRVDPARSRETGGTGLGLSIVKHIVERHKGSLDVASTVGLGTTVSVQLPVHPE